jgi:hypothetical protein
MDPELAEEHVFPVLTTLANDDLDSVRVRALEAMIKICDLITQPQNVIPFCFVFQGIVTLLFFF